MSDYERELGRMQAEIVTLRAAVQELSADVRELHELLQQGRGAWRALGAVLGLLSAMSGALGFVVSRYV